MSEIFKITFEVLDMSKLRKSDPGLVDEIMHTIDLYGQAVARGDTSEIALHKETIREIAWAARNWHDFCASVIANFDASHPAPAPTLPAYEIHSELKADAGDTPKIVERWMKYGGVRQTDGKFNV